MVKVFIDIEIFVLVFEFWIPDKYYIKIIENVSFNAIVSIMLYNEDINSRMKTINVYYWLIKTGFTSSSFLQNQK